MGKANSGRYHDEVFTGLMPHESFTEIPDVEVGGSRPRESTRPFRAARVILALTLMVLVMGVWSTDSPGSDKGKDSKAIVRPPSSPQASKPETLGQGDLYALVVGVSRYNEPRLHLDFAAKDANDFAAFLKTQGKVFRKTHVELMVDEKATKREVAKYLFHELPKAGKDDTVVLFFSGHGGTDPVHPNQFYFLTSDAEPESLEATALNMTGLRSFERLDSKRVLLIVDACHAGMPASLNTKEIDPPLEKYMRLFSESSGRVILASSRPDELSQEKANLRNSVFTYYLLRGLSGEADLNRNGIVEVDELYRYVYEKTKDETRGAQHPTKLGSVEGPFPISVLGKLDEPLKLETLFVAQDPRCSNKLCTDPPDEKTICDDPLCRDVKLKDGDTMYDGQNYQIAVRPSSTSYVYVYQIGTNGELYRLFPDSEYISPGNKKPNPLKGNEIYWIPGRSAWLRQDNQQGQEKIYVVASRSRNQVLEDLYGHLEKLRKEGRPADAKNMAQTELEHYIEHTMAPTKAIIRKAKSSSNDPKVRSFEELRVFLESPTLDAVRSVRFEHRRR